MPSTGKGRLMKASTRRLSRSRITGLALIAFVTGGLGFLPGHWLFLPTKKGDVKAAAFFGLINATSDGGGPLASPMTIDTLLSAGYARPSRPWFLSPAGPAALPPPQR